MEITQRPITILIAALGGEGGGVLADWIIAAATAEDYPVQSTSIPGVAQRTGATTYYIELYPLRTAELQGRRPVMTLAPAAADIDVMLASELLEAGRALLERLHHAGAHYAHRIDPPHLHRRRKNSPRRRTLRQRTRTRCGEGAREAGDPHGFP